MYYLSIKALLQLFQKTRWCKPAEDKLLKEAELCEVFGEKSPRTTSVKWVGSKGEYDIMAMGLLGPSLEDVFMKILGRKVNSAEFFFNMFFSLSLRASSHEQVSSLPWLRKIKLGFQILEALAHHEPKYDK